MSPIVLDRLDRHIDIGIERHGLGRGAGGSADQSRVSRAGDRGGRSLSLSQSPDARTGSVPRPHCLGLSSAVQNPAKPSERSRRRTRSLPGM